MTEAYFSMSDHKKAGFEAHQRSQGRKRNRDFDLKGNNPDDITDAPEVRPKSAKTCRERTEAGDSALSNDLVLKCIFGHLSTPALLRDFRLVNKHWNRVATETLRKRSDAYLKVNLTTDLEALTDCIKSSSNFPASEMDLAITNLDSNFEFSPETWLKVELLNRYSCLFTRLRLLITAQVPDRVVFGLLSDHFNHIVLLNLISIGLKSGNGDNFWDNGKNQFKMDNLKVIALGTEAECDRVDLTFLEALLKSCPNLQRIENPTNAHLHAVSRASKLGAVKSLRVCCCIEKDQNYPKPSGLETLIILKGDHEQEDTTSYTARTLNFSCLQPLLESNRDTLKRIDVCTAVVGGTRSYDWPTLSKLTFFNLLEPLEFPDSVQDIFPALETIRFIDRDRDTYSLSHYLWKEPLPSVTKLEVFQDLSTNDCMRISRAVPNVRHIFLQYTYNRSREALVNFWSDVSCFQHLETLIISAIELTRSNWDEFFTGIPLSCLEDLRANAELPVPVPEYIDAVLRKKKSIASVLGLKELVVHVTLAAEITPKALKERESLCRVAMHYGFNLAPPGLQIKFAYDHRSKNVHLIQQALAPASGRVIFYHWNANLGFFGVSKRFDGLVALQSITPKRSYNSRPRPRASSHSLMMATGLTTISRSTGTTTQSPVQTKQQSSPIAVHKINKDKRADDLALSNDVILRFIFKNLTTADLVTNCRLVTKQWNRVATEVLKTRGHACVGLSAWKNWEALAACIKNSPDFPFRELDLHCSKWSFERLPENWLEAELGLHCSKWGFERLPEKWLEAELLHQCSSTFTRLRLSISDAPDNVVSDLLSGPFKHIVSLKLNPIKRQKESKESNKYLFRDEHGHPLKLQCLRFIAIGSRSEESCDSIDLTFLEALLQACPNVERIENFTSAQLYAISNAGKLDAVKSLRVCTCKQEDIDYPRPTKLETLVIANGIIERDGKKSYGWCKGHIMKFSYLKPLLDSNKDTLRLLEVYTQVHGGKDGADWPKLSKLTSLKLAETLFLPETVNEIFPVLENLQLKSSEQGGTYGYHVRDYLWKEPLPSVTKLEVSRYVDSEDWAFISKAVPNVQHLFVDSDSYAKPWVGACSFERLKTCYMSPVKLPGRNLDKLFTGIPESFLEVLRKSPKLPVPAPEFIDNVLRKEGSVALLSGLKELVVHFTLFDEITIEDLQTKCPLSHAAFQYGFDMAPADLKIRYMYDHWNPNARLLEEFFSPVAERVSFGHWNANLGCWGAAERSGGLDEHLRHKEQEELDNQRARERAMNEEYCTCTHYCVTPSSSATGVGSLMRMGILLSVQF